MPKLDWRNLDIGYLNMDERTDRLAHVLQEFHRFGLNASRQRGARPDEYSGDPSKVAVMRNRTPGAIPCHFGQVEIIKRGLDNGGRNVWVNEDDVVLCSDLIQRFEYLEERLDPEFDVLWMGSCAHVNPAVWHAAGHPELPWCDCTHNRDLEPTSDPRIARAYGVWSTHSYIVRNESIPKILKLLDENVHRSIGIDYLFMGVSPQLKTYCMIPGMVWQYDNRSSIGNGITYYSHFRKLGGYVWADKMEDFDAVQFWANESR